jgi:hypothetical protein
VAVVRLLCAGELRGGLAGDRIHAIALTRFPVSALPIRPSMHVQRRATESAVRSLPSAPSRALLTPAEMLVVERKRVPYFAAGSGGMQQT